MSRRQQVLLISLLHHIKLFEWVETFLFYLLGCIECMRQTTVTDVRGVCLSVCLSITRLKSAVRAVCVGVTRYSLCQINLASCLTLFCIGPQTPRML